MSSYQLKNNVTRYKVMLIYAAFAKSGKIASVRNIYKQIKQLLNSVLAGYEKLFSHRPRQITQTSTLIIPHILLDQYMSASLN